VLRREDCARIVAEALRSFDGERLALISSVVMPNHVHALFVQNANWPLEKLLRSWNSFSSRKINSLLGRDGSLWQDTISTGWCVTKSILQIACAISVEILERCTCRVANTFCTRASLPGASSETRSVLAADWRPPLLGSHAALWKTQLLV